MKKMFIGKRNKVTIYKNIIVLFVAGLFSYSCSSNFNGFYRQTANTEYKPCAMKNKKNIKAIETQCMNDGQKQCQEQAVAWVCERSWRK